MEYATSKCQAVLKPLDGVVEQFTCPKKVWYDPRTAFCFDYTVKSPKSQ
jgi:hypothetical protein